MPRQGDPGYDPNFRWGAVAGAATYELELRQPASETSLDGGVLLWRGPVAHGATSLPFPVQLANITPYCFRVRARTADGEIGPFSYWVMFKLGDAPRWNPAATPPTIVSPTTPQLTWLILLAALLAIACWTFRKNGPPKPLFPGEIDLSMLSCRSLDRRASMTLDLSGNIFWLTESDSTTVGCFSAPPRWTLPKGGMTCLRSPIQRQTGASSKDC